MGHAAAYTRLPQSTRADAVGGLSMACLPALGEAPVQSGSGVNSLRPVQDATPTVSGPSLKPGDDNVDDRGLRTRSCSRCACACVLLTVCAFACAAIQVVHRMQLHRHYRPLVGLFSSPNVSLVGSVENFTVYEVVAGEDAARTLDLHMSELRLLGTAYQSLCRSNHACMVHILRGAHVVVSGDGGKVYRWIAHLRRAYRRTSSHPSAAPQYGVPEGAVLRTVLAGTTKDGGGDSWFQLEGSECNWRKPWALILHALDWVEYRMCDCNVGPVGTSLYTQSHPLVIPWAATGGAAGFPPGYSRAPPAGPPAPGARAGDTLRKLHRHLRHALGRAAHRAVPRRRG